MIRFLVGLSSIAVLALPRLAVAACGELEPAELATFQERLLAAQSAPPEPPPAAMTTTELAALLRKARLPQAADLVDSLPGAVEESSYDFLEGTVLKATLDGPERTEVLQFVRQGNRLIPIERGRAGRDRIVTDVKTSVRSAEAARDYVQWLLDATSEAAFWPVRTAADVPLRTTKRTETELTAEIAAVRRDLETKIEAPRAEEAGAVFVVHQDAVVARDLVRFTVKVSRLGLPTIDATTIVSDLPVVQIAAEERS